MIIYFYIRNIVNLFSTLFWSISQTTKQLISNIETEKKTVFMYALHVSHNQNVVDGNLFRGTIICINTIMRAMNI